MFLVASIIFVSYVASVSGAAPPAEPVVSSVLADDTVVSLEHSFVENEVCICCRIEMEY